MFRDIPLVIFAGGSGTRLREETTQKPKPMVEIGGKPILWPIPPTAYMILLYAAVTKAMSLKNILPITFYTCPM